VAFVAFVMKNTQHATPNSDMEHTGPHRQPANVVRRIWSSPDTILLIFAGSAAEFALSRAVDWLFWTNALPSAPIERFFETVRFAQALVFGNQATVAAAFEAVNRAHRGVERARAATISQRDYRHVLYMLIDYGERAHAVVYGPMSAAERLEHFETSLAIGRGLRIAGLAASYAEYRAQRQADLQGNIACSDLTRLLYACYQEHLGPWRMRALLALQACLVPEEVAGLLELKSRRRVELALRAYRHLPRRRVLRMLYPALLPRRYAGQLAAIERAAAPGDNSSDGGQIAAVTTNRHR
jgi:hypothetical protein